MLYHGMFLLVQVGLSGSFRQWLDVRTGNLLLEGFGMPLFERWDMKKWRSGCLHVAVVLLLGMNRMASSYCEPH